MTIIIKHFNITIKNSAAGQRLDLFVVNLINSSEKQNKVSRSQAQKLIKQGLVTVDGKVASSHYFLKAGEVVECKNIINKNQASVRMKSGGPGQKSVELKIIFNDNDFLVINKPAGLAVHRDGAADSSVIISGEKIITLADILTKKFPEIKKVGDDPLRPGIVHRLDKEVSGLMVIAKNQTAFDHLKKQFIARTIVKKYLALVYGKVDKTQDIINFPIKRSRQGYKMSAMPLTRRGQKNNDGKSAVTEFEAIKIFINYSLLKLRIKTGRTHQIRVHLSAYNHPIVGDDIYATAKTRLKNKKINLHRIFLVANILEFFDLNGEKKSFSIDLPEQLKNFLKTVK